MCRSKESANCRLELNYGQQNDHVDLIPLMMEANYRPRGWLGLIMGTRLYYKFFGKQLEEESAFEGQMDMLVREIGDRGKVGLSEAVPPTPAPAPDHTAAPTSGLGIGQIVGQQDSRTAGQLRTADRRTADTVLARYHQLPPTTWAWRAALG